MKAATCFSGIGAPETAMPHWDWVWSAEIEKFPSAVLATRHPNSVNLGDVTAEDFMQRASAFGQIDVLAGGPPCQAFSVAGLRKSMADDRGNLSLRFVRIAHAVRPRNLLVENVPGWLNTKDNAFGCFLGAILGHDAPVIPCPKPQRGQSNDFWRWNKRRKWRSKRGPRYRKPFHHCVWPSVGMASGPLGRLCWTTLDAQFFGVAQRRRRVFVVVDFGNGADPAAVLFEPQSLLGDHPPRRETGQRTAGTISARTQGGGGLGTDFEIDGGQTAICAEIAPTLNAAFADKQGLEDQHINGGGDGLYPSVSMCLNAGAMGRIDAESETLIPVNRCDFDEDALFGIDYENNATSGQTAMGPLLSGSRTGGGRPLPAIAFSSKDYGNDATEDLSPTLRSMSHADSHANGGGQMAVAFEEPTVIMERGRQGGGNLEYRQDGTANAILTPNGGRGGMGVGAIQHHWQVRRLTPTECERLQGFPDGFTDIEYRGKPAADGPRYKALGNSWAVPVGRWILERIERFMPEREA